MASLITDRLFHRLEMIQHSAARIIMCIKRHNRQSMTAVLRHLHLATREVAYQLQDSCTRVPRSSRSGACVGLRVNADYVVHYNHAFLF